MTKWKRLRKLREKKRFGAEALRPKAEREEAKQTEPEKISKSIQRSQETEKLGSTKTSKPITILAQIPQYAYLLAIFVFLAAVFFPLVTAGADAAYNFVIGGVVTLFLGLAGGILLFKGATSDGSRGILLIVGFVLITISIALIFLIQEWWSLVFIRA